jgi:hypothetical protein
MSTNVTMQELELETAELLPSRETLWSSHCGSSSHGGGITTVVTGSGDGNNDGNGGLLSVLSGNLDGDLDGNTIVL